MTQLAAILLAIMGQAVTKVMKNKSSMDVLLPLNITVTQNYSIINLKNTDTNKRNRFSKKKKQRILNKNKNCSNIRIT